MLVFQGLAHLTEVVSILSSLVIKHFGARGKGLGTEVTRLVTNYGFRELGLHRIELTAYCDNVAAIKAYEKAGYQHEGIKRESGYRNGRFMDKVQMSVLSREWPAT
ncbi:N-acetyltransferase GCN5 [Vibrio cholerae]|nr:N-acetyltransferase GCN5 [Vibrio cholerae]